MNRLWVLYINLKTSWYRRLRPRPILCTQYLRNKIVTALRCCEVIAKNWMTNPGGTLRLKVSPHTRTPETTPFTFKEIASPSPESYHFCAKNQVIWLLPQDLIALNLMTTSRRFLQNLKNPLKQIHLILRFACSNQYTNRKTEKNFKNCFFLAYKQNVYSLIKPILFIIEMNLNPDERWYKTKYGEENDDVASNFLVFSYTRQENSGFYKNLLLENQKIKNGNVQQWYWVMNQEVFIRFHIHQFMEQTSHLQYTPPTNENSEEILLKR